MNYKIGDKIKFADEKGKYVIRECNDRYLICTKPYNFKKTFFYTIVDLERNIRGADNYYTKFDYMDPKELKQAMIELMNGKLEIGRNRVPLKFEEIHCEGA